ncbi:MAG: antitoxin Xre-like helix-turn-helix domain-containing protein [Stenotrophobium sp.]
MRNAKQKPAAMPAVEDTHLDAGQEPRAWREFSGGERAQMAKMVTRLFEHWALDMPTQALLLGLSPDSRSTVTRYRKGAPLPAARDLLDRVGNLFGIHKSLRLLYPHNRELAYAWPTARNRGLDNLSPLEVMLMHGLPGMVAVRGYLDWLRGR